MQKISYTYDITGGHEVIKNGTIISHGDNEAIQVNIAGMHIVFRRIHDPESENQVLPVQQDKDILVINIVNMTGEVSSDKPVRFAKVDGLNKDTGEIVDFILSMHFVFRTFDNKPLSKFMIHYSIYAEQADGAR